MCLGLNLTNTSLLPNHIVYGCIFFTKPIFIYETEKVLPNQTKAKVSQVAPPPEPKPFNPNDYIAEGVSR